MIKPKILIIEGTSCSGKTTLCQKIVSNLSNSVYYKMLTSHTTRGNMIRDLDLNINSRENAELHLKDLIESFEEIKAIRNSGYHVVVDRFVPSFLAFCETFLSKNDFEDIQKITPKFFDYEKLFLLEASVDLRLNRMKIKNNVSLFDDMIIRNEFYTSAIKRHALTFNHVIINTEETTDTLEIILQNINH